LRKSSVLLGRNTNENPCSVAAFIFKCPLRFKWTAQMTRKSIQGDANHRPIGACMKGWSWQGRCV